LPQSGVIKDFVDFKSKPHLRVKTVGTMKLASVKPSTTFTIAFGPSASAGAALTLGLAGGVYGANVPGGGEIGFFGTFNIGVVTNFSVSVVNQGMILFGLPAVVLAGVTIAVGVNVGGKVVTGGGFLVFLDTAPAWTLVGFGFQLGAGANYFPVRIRPRAARVCAGCRSENPSECTVIR